MPDILKFIRIKNLLFIAFIQLVVQYTVITPLMQKYGFDISTNYLCVVLLILATVLIAAGGYILNDYFDVKIDVINKPNDVIVTRSVTKQKAMLLHQILTGLGAVAGLMLAWINKSFTLAFVFIVVPGMLWFYSASYKRQFLIGNLIVALLAGLSVFVVAINQIAILHHEYSNLIYETPIPGDIYGWVGGLAVFSFLTTLIREIVKDIEDIEGDREMECRTLPVKWGIQATKKILYVLIVIEVLLLYFVNFECIPFEGSLTLKYIIWGLTLPFIYLVYLLFKADDSAGFASASRLLKFIMIIGICYGFVFYYLMAKTYGLSLFNLFIVK
ncbi:MAG: geranylgeranylglycerol-phosphate geranylgeranyltransferase [Paludibacter sp.]|nr:geranylgeranylglycerol-phosphate geranylgeranyltransferase [Paludibacter sp.]